MLKVTTSWDDGDTLDRRLSSLLSRYGMRGTFYISKKYRPQRLSEGDIRELSGTHEIGAHTLSHPDLRVLSSEKRKEEIEGSKKWLEEILGFPVKMFCYPRGLHDELVVAAARNAGFLGARTTKLSVLTSPSDPFRLHTTIQVYPFPLRKLDERRYYFGRLLEPYAQRAPGLRALGVSTLSMYSWLRVAKNTLDIARESGEVFHLWGHSWEIEKYGMWGELEEFLEYASGNEHSVYLTNSEVLI